MTSFKMGPDLQYAYKRIVLICNVIVSGEHCITSVIKWKKSKKQAIW